MALKNVIQFCPAVWPDLAISILINMREELFYINLTTIWIKYLEDRFSCFDFNSTQTNRQKTQKIHILRAIETFLPQQDL